jgi:hypothetical protein
MKNLTKIAFTFLLLAGVFMNAQALKKGSVTYKIVLTGNDEAAEKSSYRNEYDERYDVNENDHSLWKH